MDKLKELLPKWEIFKKDACSNFTNQDIDIVKEYYSKHFGTAPRVGNCRGCIIELIKQVFRHYEDNKN